VVERLDTPTLWGGQNQRVIFIIALLFTAIADKTAPTVIIVGQLARVIVTVEVYITDIYGIGGVGNLTPLNAVVP
jgi:hypothetical protein